eukprot:CAMPEP_0171221912 /NCGR_PEP_ID=MMETSP0790-20130122/34997_1 /TAXON_ID=2925 /ORGANISM="Alexandrium catenella, Strain OF101" /LENGTH=105 /DNA_ID=CAMNT_0011687851 /DNA_START=142 /DNA_END=456 /DNA_ORIENTATION=+
MKVAHLLALALLVAGVPAQEVCDRSGSQPQSASLLQSGSAKVRVAFQGKEEQGQRPAAEWAAQDEAPKGPQPLPADAGARAGKGVTGSAAVQVWSDTDVGAQAVA